MRARLNIGAQHPLSINDGFRLSRGAGREKEFRDRLRLDSGKCPRNCRGIASRGQSLKRSGPRTNIASRNDLSALSADGLKGLPVQIRVLDEDQLRLD